MNFKTVNNGTVEQAMYHATDKIIGGVKVASVSSSNIVLTSNGDISVSPADTEQAGVIKLGGGTSNYLRADGTWSTPPNTNTHYTTKLIAGASGSTVNAAVNSGNVYLRLFDDTTNRNNIQLKGSGATTITSDANGIITVNSTNTTYGTVTSAANGLVPSLSGSTTNYLRGDGTWSTPPNTDTHFTTKLISGAQDSTVNTAVTSGNVVYLRLFDNSTNRNNILLKGAGGMTITSDSLGAVTFNSANTTYNTVTSSAPGLVPTLEGSTTKYLRADGTWNVPTNTDTKVTQNISTTNSTYPLLLTATANATANAGATTAIFAKDIKANPSSGNITANSFTGNLTGNVTGSVSGAAGGNAASATKLATGRTLKVSLNSTAASTAFNGTADISNIGVAGTLGVAHGGTGLTASPSLLTSLGSTVPGSVFQASPIAGITGVLGADHGGTGKTKLSDVSVGAATKATQDGSGKVISDTYVKKESSIEGLPFDINSSSRLVTCSTDAATQEKTLTIDGFVLEHGARLAIRWAATNTANYPTLNINGEGAHYIVYAANTCISKGYLHVNYTQQYVYDAGTFTVTRASGDTVEVTGVWRLMGLYDTNTDTKATHTLTTTNANYNLLAMSTAAATANKTEGTRFSTGIYMNPSTNAITATTFNGSLNGNAATATKATQDKNGADITTTYETKANAITGVSVSGKTLTFTKGNGTTVTLQTQDTDTNTHYTTKLIVGANNSTVNAATTNGNTNIRLFDDSTVRATVNIKGTGATAVTSDSLGAITINSTNTTYSQFSTTAAGLVPKSDGATTKYLRADGTWQVPPDTNTDTHWTTKAIVGASDSTVNAATTNGNTNIRVFDNNTARATINIKGTGATSVTSDSLGAITINSTNTTYSNVTSTTAGLAPASGGGTTKYLRADGTWQVPPDTNTTYSQFSTTAAGLAPKSDGATTKYLRADGTWQVPPNTTYKVASSANITINGTLVPSIASGTTNKYLRSDGTWQVPPNTTYSIATTSSNGLMSSADKTTFDNIPSTYETKANAITGVSVNGRTLTFTKGNGTTVTLQTQDNNTDTHYTTYLYAGASNGNVNAATTNGNTYLIVTDNTTARSRVKLAGAGATTVTSDSLGAVTINSTNTTYSQFSTTAAGLVPKSDGATTKYLRADGTWQVPPDTDTNTHYTTKVIVGANNGTVNAATTNGNTNIRVFDDSTARATINIKGTGATAVTSDSLGAITINSTNTTYSDATTAKSGLMSAADKTAVNNLANTYETKANAITGVAVSGKTLTFTKGNGATVTLQTQDTDTNTHYTTKVIVGANNGTVNAATTNGNTNIRVFDDNTARATINIKGTGAAAVTSDSLGVITINSTNTTYSDATTAKSGLMSAADKVAVNGLATTYETKANAITGVSVSGKTLTFTKGNGSTVTLQTQDTNTDTHYTTYLYAGASNGNVNAATTNGNTYLIVTDNTTARSRVKLAGAGATTVTSDSLGSVTINSTNTTYSQFSTTAAGLVPKSGGGTANYLRADGTWATPPNTDTHWTTYLYAGASNGNTNATTTNGNTYLIITDNTTARSRVKLAGAGATTVTSDASGNVTINSTNTDTDTKVTQNVSTTDNTYPILLSPTANATANATTTAIFGSGVLVNPNTKIITAAGFKSTVSTGTYVGAVKEGGGGISMAHTSFSAAWNAPTKNYRVACATYPSNNDNIQWYSVSNTNISSNTNTVNRAMSWNADTGILTATGFAGPLTGNVTGNVSGTATTATSLSASDKFDVTHGHLNWGASGEASKVITKNTLAFWTGTFDSLKSASNLTHCKLGAFGNMATVNSPVPITNGGTGQTTAAAARNALGLGNTTGALPVANGGTGTTTEVGIYNVVQRAKSCVLYQNASPFRPWFKALTITLNSSWKDATLLLSVKKTTGDGSSGIFVVHVATNNTAPSMGIIRCLMNDGLNLSHFKIRVPTAWTDPFEFWVYHNNTHSGVKISVLDSSTDRANGSFTDGKPWVVSPTQNQNDAKAAIAEANDPYTKSEIPTGGTINSVVLTGTTANASYATTAGSCTGNATTATKATQDKNGADITTTYLTTTAAASTYLGKTAKAASATTADSATTAATANTLAAAAIYDVTTGHLDWSNHVHKLITNQTLAYWNGRYNATSSNLAYCNKGAFGNMATVNSPVPAANGGTGYNNFRLGYYSHMTFCIADGGSVPTNPWYKVATFTSTAGSLTNSNITFLVQSGLPAGEGKYDILRVYVRTNADGTAAANSCSLRWLAGSLEDPLENWALVITPGTSTTSAVSTLWVKLTTSYAYRIFTVLHDGDANGSNYNRWVYSNVAKNSGDAATLPTGTQIFSTTTKRQVNDDVRFLNNTKLRFGTASNAGQMYCPAESSSNGAVVIVQSGQSMIVGSGEAGNGIYNGAGKYSVASATYGIPGTPDSFLNQESLFLASDNRVAMISNADGDDSSGPHVFDLTASGQARLDGHDIGGDTNWYFEVSTDAATAAKVNDAVSGYSEFFRLKKGVIVMIYLKTANTAASPTLNINNTGAKKMRTAKVADFTASNMPKGMYTFLYTGNYYYCIGSPNDF